MARRVPPRAGSKKFMAISELAALAQRWMMIPAPALLHAQH